MEETRVAKEIDGTSEERVARTVLEQTSVTSSPGLLAGQRRRHFSGDWVEIGER